MSQPEQKIALEFAPKAPPTDPIDELKKKAKALLKKYVYAPLGITAVSLGSGTVGFKMAKNDVNITMEQFVNITILVTCGFLLWQLRPKKVKKP